MNKELFPPYYPEHLQKQREIWISSFDPYNPQLSVTGGPSCEEITESYKQQKEIDLGLESRTADMDDNDPSESLGRFKVMVIDLVEGPHGELHFLARGNLPFVGESLIWVWDYSGEGQGAGADVVVND